MYQLYSNQKDNQARRLWARAKHCEASGLHVTGPLAAKKQTNPEGCVQGKGPVSKDRAGQGRAGQGSAPAMAGSASSCCR